MRARCESAHQTINFSTKEVPYRCGSLLLGESTPLLLLLLLLLAPSWLLLASGSPMTPAVAGTTATPSFPSLVLIFFKRLPCGMGLPMVR